MEYYKKREREQMKEKKEWFSEWFNSPYYHLLYQNRGDQEAKIFIDQLLRHLQPQKSARILDIPCGKGRHSIYLNSCGFDVTGMDLSPESIALAKKNESDSLRFHRQDMRQPISQKYDLVLNLFTSLGYFESWEENDHIIKNLVSAIAPKGKLVIDFLNVYQTFKQLKKQEIIKRDSIEFVIRKKVENDTIIKDIEFEDQGLRYFFQERLKALDVEYLEKILKCLHLNIEQVFGSYHLDSFDSDKSDRLIFIASKP